MEMYTTSLAMKETQTQVKSEMQYLTRSDGKNKRALLARGVDIVIFCG